VGRAGQRHQGQGKELHAKGEFPSLSGVRKDLAGRVSASALLEGHSDWEVTPHWRAGRDDTRAAAILLGLGQLDGVPDRAEMAEQFLHPLTGPGRGCRRGGSVSFRLPRCWRVVKLTQSDGIVPLAQRRSNLQAQTCSGFALQRRTRPGRKTTSSAALAGSRDPSSSCKSSSRRASITAESLALPHTTHHHAGQAPRPFGWSGVFAFGAAASAGSPLSAFTWDPAPKRRA